MPGRAASQGPLVGRDDVLDELALAAAGAAQGRGSIVVLTGEAGIGKTTLARAVAQQVPEGMAVTWGTSPADRSAPPFWPWQGLVDLADPDPRRGTDDAVGAPRLEQLTALREQLHAAARDRPRLHVLEDLQWADVASVLLLAHLGTTVTGAPLLVLATLRTGEERAAPLDDAIEQVRRTALVRELGPLGDGDIVALLRRTGTEPDERLVELVRSRTGGNPLFVTELLRALPSGGSAEHRLAAAAEDVPTRVADLLLHRLGRLPAAVADALTTAAVLGAEGDVVTLAAAHGTDPAPLLDLLDQARAAHLLDAAPAGRWQFRHQLIRDAVYATVTGRERARRHALVLEALAADPTNPIPLVAHHALAAQPLVDPDRAVALAARAGEATLAQHAYEEAVAWFARALAGAPADTSPRWRAELLILSAEAQRHIGDTAAARAAFLQAADLTDDPDLLARAALGYADPGADLGIAYRTEDAVTAPLIDRAIAAQPTLDDPTVVQLQARLAAHLYFSEEPDRARALADDALARARRLGDPRALAAATAVVHDGFVVGQAPLEQQLAQSAELLEWAGASGSVAARLTAHRARVLDLLAAGDRAGVDAEILAFRRLAEPLRAPGYLWWPALWSAMHALLEGRHELAEERALEAHALGEGPSPSLAFFNLSFLLFFLRREQGRLAEMEQATRDTAAERADIPALRVALAFLLAELGRTDEAAAGLRGFDEPALERLHDRNWPASWFQLARAASIVGDRDLAARLLDARHHPMERCVQVSLGTVCLGAADLATAWLHHTVGDLDAAAEHYAAAEEVNARLGARSWLAQARADHARLLRERGRKGDADVAAQLAQQARDAAAEIGLATLAPPEAEPAAARVAAPAAFRRAGSVWQVDFADHVVQIPDARGMRDLAYLLSRPAEAVSVLELAHDDGDAPPATRGAEALDERARRELRARLRELDEDEADAEAAADGERAALARERRQELAEAVARDFGLGGRSRRLGDPVERARKTVSTRIRRTIAAVGRAHPELGRHLERSIDTGAWCAYRPAEPVDWQT